MDWSDIQVATEIEQNVNLGGHPNRVTHIEQTFSSAGTCPGKGDQKIGKEPKNINFATAYVFLTCTYMGELI